MSKSKQFRGSREIWLHHHDRIMADLAEARRIIDQAGARNRQGKGGLADANLGHAGQIIEDAAATHDERARDLHHLDRSLGK